MGSLSKTGKAIVIPPGATVKPCLWLNQMEMGFAIRCRRLRNRSSVASPEEMQESISRSRLKMPEAAVLGFRQKIMGQIFPFPFWSKEVVRSQESEVACGKELPESNGAVASF